MKKNQRARRVIRGRAGLVLAAAASLTLAGVGFSPSVAGAAKSPFNVLMIVGTTGPVAPPTNAEVQATKAAASVLNKTGGMDGHKITVKVINDNLDPTTALNELQQAVSSSNKPNMVFAGTTSNETLAMLPLLTRQKLLSMQLAGSSIIDSPYEFALPNYIPSQTQAVIASIRKQYPSAKKIGIIISDDAQGTALLSGYEKVITADGLTYSAQTFSDTATNVTPQLQALQATNPDVIIASGYGAVGGYILQDRASLGWNVPVVGDGQLGANDLPALVSSADLAGVSLCVSTSSIYKPLAQQSKAFQTFYKATQAEGANFSQAIVLYSLSYDDLMLTSLAARQANSIAAPAIAKALEHLKQPAVKPYVSWSIEGFTPTIHVEQAPVTDYTLASPFLKQGMNLPLGSK